MFYCLQCDWNFNLGESALDLYICEFSGSTVTICVLGKSRGIRIYINAMFEALHRSQKKSEVRNFI